MRLLLYRVTLVPFLAWVAVGAAAGPAPPVLVAIVDTGFDIEHRHLSNSVWREPSRLTPLPSFIDYSIGHSTHRALCLRGEMWDALKLYSRTDRIAFSETEKRLFNKSQRPHFQQTLRKCLHFVHGTHIAGIVLQGIQHRAKVLPVKPAVLNSPAQIHYFLRQFLEERGDWPTRAPLEEVLSTTAKAMANFAFPRAMAAYYNGHRVAVANNAFNIDIDFAEQILNILSQWREQPLKAQMRPQYMALFLREMLDEIHRNYVAAAPETLFVFSAGNGARGQNQSNDHQVMVPSNIRATNAITVGSANLEQNGLAEFSHFGGQTVDLLAPGIAVHSSVPNNQYLKISGSSQAAAYISNLAARMKVANPQLSAAQIKSIITGTVTVYPSLEGKVISGGIVNRQRALQAAKSGPMGLGP